MIEFITMEEVATLESLTYNTVQKRVRYGDEYKTKYFPSENGGKDRVLIEVSSLSNNAKRVYREQKKKLEQAKTTDPPWFVYADYNWYQSKYAKYFYKGIEIAKYVKKYIEIEVDKTPYLSEFATELGMKQRNFCNFVTLYYKAEVWANDLEEATGENYDFIKVLAMCRKPRESNPFPSIPEIMRAWIENKMYSPLFSKNRQPISNLYDDLELECLERDWEAPCYHSVWRYVNYIWKMDGKGAETLVARDLRYWKNRFMMKKYRDTGKLKVLEVVQGDVHTMDSWVKVMRPNGQYQAIRPCLVAWIDTRSRTLVGWRIAEAPDAQIMKESLVNVIYPKKNEKLPYGVPRFLLIDNGKEYTAETLTGRPRTVRVALDADSVGYYRSIGIEDDMRSLPYQPWSKAQMERFFGTVCLKFSNRMASYTGTLTGSSTDAKVYKNIKGMLESGELMNIDEFAEQFEKWVTDKYHKRKHKGLMIQGEDVPAPISVWNAAKGTDDMYFKPAPPIEYTMSLLSKSFERKVTNMGVQITLEGKPIFYTSQELHRHQGEKITFKYFPDDISKILCYTLEGERICEATSYELLTLGPKVSEAGFIEHNKEQKRQLKDDRNTVFKRQMTYEEREAAKETMLTEAGKKNVGPALDFDDQPIVSLPMDKQFRDEQKLKKQERKPKNNTNAYFEKQAEEAIEMLQKLG